MLFFPYSSIFTNFILIAVCCFMLLLYLTHHTPCGSFLFFRKLRIFFYRLTDYSTEAHFYLREAMLVRYLLSSRVCPSFRLFVTSQSCAKTAKRRIT